MKAMDLNLRVAVPLDPERPADRFRIADGGAGSMAGQREVAALFAPMSPRVEALRAVRTQLLLRWFGVDARSAIAIVSPHAGDGRSWLAANLAVLLAQLGAPTLLIDADLRSPRQHELFGLGASDGLATALRDGVTPSLVRIDGVPQLHVLPAGPVPSNPLELLSSTALVDVLATARAHFRYIVLDTPPADRYADAQTCAARAGGFALVARRGKTSLPAARELTRDFALVNAPCAGSVLIDA